MFKTRFIHNLCKFSDRIIKSTVKLSALRVIQFLNRKIQNGSRVIAIMYNRNEIENTHTHTETHCEEFPLEITHLDSFISAASVQAERLRSLI